jgi:hypothetical protein
MNFKLKTINFLLFIFLFCLITVGNVFCYPTVYPKGTTIYEPEKAYKGYTIYKANGLNRVLLINMEGDVINYWEKSNFTIRYSEPLSNGNLLSFFRDRKHQFDGIAELDWDSNVVWVYHNAIKKHHDFERLDNGNTLILCGEYLDIPSISPFLIANDYIIEVNQQGEIVWRWNTVEHFDEFGFSVETKNLISEKGGDWAHTNSIQSLPENSLGETMFQKGNLLVSQRNTNIIFIIDKYTGHIVWQVGPDDNLTIAQHDAKMITENLAGAGNILVFDNGGKAWYSEQRRLHSKVVEIEPVTKKIVWEYYAVKSNLSPWTFFSSGKGGAQRLPNGNTLIDEGLTGRFFEVTTEGEIVWEYINPFFGTGTWKQYQYSTNSCYRVWRVDLDWPTLEVK